MELDKLYLSGYGLIVYTGSGDGEFEQEESFIRKIHPDYDFSIQDKINLPVDTTIEDWMRHFSINAGDLFLSLVNIFNNLEFYKRLIYSLLSNWNDSVEKFNKLIIEKDKSLFKLTESGLMMLDSPVFERHNREIDLYGRQAVFYQAIIDYIESDILYEDGYFCYVMSGALNATEGIEIPYKNIYDGIDMNFNPKLRTIETTIEFGGESQWYEYHFKDFSDVVLFDLFEFLKQKVSVKRCANCGKYFIPASRSDEIYCGNYYKNGKTCREVGYEIKVKNDVALSTYRKIYKTQNARKQRNGHRPNIAKHFEQWAKLAKKKLILCQNKEITIEELVKEISGDSWIKNGLPDD